MMGSLLHRRVCVLVAAAALGLPTSAVAQADKDEPNESPAPGIIAVQENGRTVYVNAERLENPRPRARYRVLVYWSNTEHRWKPVPHPTPASLESARTAAAEVAGFVASRPRGPSEAAQNPNYAVMSRGRRVSAAEIDDAIEQAARKHGVDPNLVRALVKVESNFNPRAVSNRGAMGLMQLMPATARSLSVTNPFDPQQNVDAGVRHLKQLLSDFHGDVTLSLAAYNAGAGAVTRNRGVPPYVETQNYVKRITTLYGSNKDVKAVRSDGMPLRMFRGPDGTIHITNTGE